MTKANDFLTEIAEVSKKHNLSLGHQDEQGAFLVERYSKRNLQWLMEARQLVHVVVYLRKGEIVATCPPDSRPKKFDNWEAGEGYNLLEAKADALAVLDWKADLQ